MWSGRGRGKGKGKGEGEGGRGRGGIALCDTEYFFVFGRRLCDASGWEKCWRGVGGVGGTLKRGFVRYFG